MNIENMTARQMIRAAVLTVSCERRQISIDGEVTAENVDEIFSKENECYGLARATEDVRPGAVETGILAEECGHYESKSVASCIAGQWVGWIYWYGGGKHGEPEDVDWMGDAYLLDCVEIEKTVMERIFIKT